MRSILTPCLEVVQPLLLPPMKISLLFFSILSGLSVALVAFLPLIPQAKIGRGFFRFNIFLSLFFLILLFPLKPYVNFKVPAQMMVHLTPSPNHMVWAMTLFLIFAVMITLLFLQFGRLPEKHVNPLLYVTAVFIGIFAVILDSFLYRPTLGGWWGENILVPLNIMSSTALLGSSVFAMLLGHWYLVQFDLDKQLLRRVSIVFVFALLLRCLVLGISLFVYRDNLLPMISLQGHGLFFWMRVGMGILLPIILAYMIYETAKMGANQACTGLLYIVVLFIFMGEAVSRYLFFLKGIPL